METPSLIIVVKQGDSVLLVRNAKREWTLPGGHLESEIEPDHGIKDFARDSLYPFYDDLVVRSVRLLFRPREEVVIEDERQSIAIFECKIEGRAKKDMRDSMWFATLDKLPPHAVCEGMRAIIEALSRHLDRPASD